MLTSSRAMLIGILCELEALADARRVCHQGNDTAPEQFGNFLKRLTKLCKSLRIRTELVFRDDDAGRYPNIEMGQIKLVRYPWIPQRFLYRNETDIEDANKKLRNCSNTLEIRRSPVEGQNKKFHYGKYQIVSESLLPEILRQEKRSSASKDHSLFAGIKEMVADTATTVLPSFHHGPLCFLRDAVPQ